MDSVAPEIEKPDREPQEFKEWDCNFILALLRFCGSLVLAASLFLLSLPYVSPLYDELDIVWSIIAVVAFHLFAAVYFTWFYRGKTVLPDAFGALLTGVIYFCGGVVLAVMATYPLIPLVGHYIRSPQHDTDFLLAALFYLLCGLAIAIIVMKDKRRF